METSKVEGNTQDGPNYNNASVIRDLPLTMPFALVPKIDVSPVKKAQMHSAAGG